MSYGSYDRFEVNEMLNNAIDQVYKTVVEDLKLALSGQYRHMAGNHGWADLLLMITKNPDIRLPKPQHVHMAEETFTRFGKEQYARHLLDAADQHFKSGDTAKAVANILVYLRNNK